VSRRHGLGAPDSSAEQSCTHQDRKEIVLRISRGIKLGAFAVATAMVLTACGSSGGSGNSSSGGAGANTSAASTNAPVSSGSAPATTDTSSTSTSAAPQLKSLKVGLAYDVGGRGDKSFNDLAAAGLEKAKTDFNITTKELSAVAGESDQQKADRLTLLAQAGYNPIVAVGFAYATALGKVAPKFPKTNFAIIDDNSVVQPNVEGLLFSENQSSYLVGVAAALADKSGTIGFIGGVQTPLIQKFQAGYVAGAKAVKPSIKVSVSYISQPPDFTGFNDPAKAQTIAEGMYDNGADVVYHAAGGSGSGLFKAAAEKKQLCIGVDSDQYQTASADQKPWILTSALKGVDTAVYNFIEQDGTGKFKAGYTRFSLKDNGVGYATSNPKLDPYKATIEKYKAKLISGAITAPTTP
jgi:basic membrane protein A and related proteins